MVVRVATLAGAVERETQVAAEITADPRFELVFRCVDRAEALATLRAGTTDAVVSVGVTSWFDFQCVEEAHRGEVRLFGIATDPIEAEMLEVGGFTVVQDLVHLQELSGTTLRLKAAPPIDPDGRIVAVWGPKGSPGRTTVAIELAAVLGHTEASTLLVDADLYGGDIAQLLGVVEELPGIVPICRMGARGDLREDDWVRVLRRLPGGPSLLPGLLRADLWGEVSVFGWTQLLDAARRCFRNTVVDVGFCLEAGSSSRPGPGRNDVAIASLEAADRIVLVVRADPVGIRSFLWSFTDHRDLLDGDRAIIVVNRVRAGEEAEVSRFLRRHLGRPPQALIADRPDHVMPAVWQGVPVAVSDPGSVISEAMRDVAAILGAEISPRGFLSRLAGRSAHV